MEGSILSYTQFREDDEFDFQTGVKEVLSWRDAVTTIEKVLAEKSADPKTWEAWRRILRG
jgi:hypothetical protein